MRDLLSLFLNWKLLEDKFGFKLMNMDNTMHMNHLWLDLMVHACNPIF